MIERRRLIEEHVDAGTGDLLFAQDAGEVFPENLTNTPLYVVNGGRDPLYPVRLVANPLDWLQAMGVALTFRPQPEAGHDTSWWPMEQAPYEAFVAAHPRPAYPEKISWETERSDRGNRYSWLIISALGTRSSDVALADVNTFSPGLGRLYELYDRKKASGRVDAVRKGNAFSLQTRGVREVTLLLHAEQVDFAKEVTVHVNGRPVFAGMVKPDVATVMKWAARDDDRTQLYAAELKVTVP